MIHYIWFEGKKIKKLLICTEGGVKKMFLVKLIIDSYSYFCYCVKECFSITASNFNVVVKLWIIDTVPFMQYFCLYRIINTKLEKKLFVCIFILNNFVSEIMLQDNSVHIHKNIIWQIGSPIQLQNINIS